MMPEADEITPELPVTFAGLQRGYVATEAIRAELTYAHYFRPSPEDWIAIVPAGLTKFSLFCALKNVPVPVVSQQTTTTPLKVQRTFTICDDASKNDPISNTNAKSAEMRVHSNSSLNRHENSEPGCSKKDANDLEVNVERLFPLMPHFRKAKTVDEKREAFHQKPPQRNGSVSFSSEESKLPPRNFYQIAYVQKTTRDILAFSSVFYVEAAKFAAEQVPTKLSQKDIFHSCNKSMTVSCSTRVSVDSASTSSSLPTVIRHQPTSSCGRLANGYHHSHSHGMTAILTNKKPIAGWRSFFCGASSGDRFADSTTSFTVPPTQEVDEDCSEDEEWTIAECSERHRLLSSTDDGFDEEKEKPATRLRLHQQLSSGSGGETAQTRPPSSSSITQFLLDLWRQPFSAPSGNYGIYSEAERRSASMYEIGATAYAGAAKGSHEPYQKMVCQLTHSNNNLLHENERLSRRVQQLEMAMREHMEQMNSVYYTLFRNGIAAIAFPDGENIPLSQFRGQLLNFVKPNETTPRAPLKKAMNTFTNGIRDPQRQPPLERTSDLSSESSLSSGSVDQDELKAAMLKRITKSKYNDDLDDFVNWLNDSGAQSARFESERKSRSLEEHMQESLRIRTPLQRSARVDRTQSESEILDVAQSSHSSPVQMLPQIQENPNRMSGKSKTLKHRTQSLAGSKINGFLGSRRTSSCARQNTDGRSSQRKSLANLASLRNTNTRQPRRNLI